MSVGSSAACNTAVEAAAARLAFVAARTAKATPTSRGNNVKVPLTHQLFTKEALAIESSHSSSRGGEIAEDDESGASSFLAAHVYNVEHFTVQREERVQRAADLCT